MKKYFYLILSLGLFIGSCSKNADPIIEEEDETETPVDVPFHVKLEGKQTFKTGERVAFTIDGNPESIDFYSGEYGHEYAYRNGRPIPSGMSLSFDLHSNRASFSGHIFLLVSTDFDGDYSSFSSVQAATWVDVTDRLFFPIAANTYTAAGPVNLSDLTELDKPFYFSIKYVNKLVSGATAVWHIRNPKWYSVLPGGNELIGEMSTTVNSMGFKVVQENPASPASTVSASGASAISDRFNFTGNINAPDGQTWLVSKGFTDIQEMIGAKATSVPIKSPGNSPLTNYRHVYTAPGTYKAHFVAIVQDEDGTKHEEIKSVDVVIEE